MTVLVLEWCHYWLKIGDSIGIGLHQYQLLRQECVNNINLFNYGALQTVVHLLLSEDLRDSAKF